ncbi:MAG: universal stress protein [Gemmatimonadota bacterium]|jgi:nucleotide-binding universal stress UspA family protein
MLPTPEPTDFPHSMGVEAHDRTRLTAPVLAAVRVGAHAEPALLSAASLGGWLGAPVHALTVVEPMVSFAVESDLAGVLAEAEREQLARARPALDANVREVAGASALAEGGWTAEASAGVAPAIIAERAHALHARCVVMGLGQHALLDRLFGSETAVRTLRLLTKPLLAVPHAFAVPCSRIVVASDFSPASTAAARLALTLLKPGGTLTLVHVSARLEAAPPAWLAVQERVIPGLFAEQVRAIAAPADRHVEWTQRAGQAIAEVLDVAARADAPLVALGRHGLKPIERLFVGSTSSALLRRSDRAVLVATTD